MPLTCKELLKWKFGHENSVDFLLKQHAGQWTLYLKGGNQRSATQGHPPGLTPLSGGKVRTWHSSRSAMDLVTLTLTR